MLFGVKPKERHGAQPRTAVRAHHANSLWQCRELHPSLPTSAPDSGPAFSLQEQA